MKVKLNREKFAEAWSVAVTCTKARSPKPILSTVMMDCSKDGVVLVATTMEIGIRIDVDGVEVEDEGAICIPAGKMTAILKEGKDEELKMELDANDNIVVKLGRSRFKMPCMDPKEFPVIKSFDRDKYHSVSNSAFASIIRRTVFATDTESSRYALGGILIEALEDGGMIGVGTDGRRLAKMQIDGKSVGGHKSGESSIIPSSSCRRIDKMLANAVGEVKYADAGSQVVIGLDNATIYVQLLQGRFPQWRQVFPDSLDRISVEFVSDPLASAVRQAMIMHTKEDKGVEFKLSDGLLSLSASVAEIGDTNVELPVSCDTERHVNLDGSYVVDFCKCFAAEDTFEVSVGSHEAAVVFKKDSYEYVIMPLVKGGH